MNLNYISGFFDGDGSISLSKHKSTNLYKSISIDFTNTDINILKEIQSFLLNKLNIKGYVISKMIVHSNHTPSYTLKYSHNNAYLLCHYLNSIHYKKLYRINCIIKYYKEVTIRNGKYTQKEQSRKLAFERLFFMCK
jgi:hypothetical protein